MNTSRVIFAVLTAERVIGWTKTRHSNACFSGYECSGKAYLPSLHVAGQLDTFTNRQLVVTRVFAKVADWFWLVGTLIAMTLWVLFLATCAIRLQT